MTIKEMEELSGMPRANIRFYEAEGLLRPDRNANGYRDYSQQDLEVLKRIKLLRTLHIPLEEIKALHAGEHELSEALEKHIAKLSKEKEELAQAQDVCRIMQRDGACYQNLNAGKYLHNIESEREKYFWELYWEMSEDTIPKVQAPWRRFFARAMDEALYSVIWSGFLTCVCNVNAANLGAAGDFVNILVVLVLTVLLEPLQLSLFGSTLGKWILGLRIADSEDRPMNYQQALQRTWQVLWYGMGLQIPVYNLYRYWKSYEACVKGENLEWEYVSDSNLILRDEKPWRTVVYVVVRILMAAVMLCAGVVAQMPRYRGDITAEQFCENYRRLEAFYGMNSDAGRKLDDTGKWVEASDSNAVTIYLGGFPEKQDFVFTEENGMATEIGFALEVRPQSGEEPFWIPDCQEQMQMAVLAFVGAQEEFRHFSGDKQEMLELIASHPFEDYSFTMAGVTVTCDVEYSGYERQPAFGALYPVEGAESFYSLRFVMQKAE